MIGRIIGIVLLVAVLVVAIHDGLKYADAHRTLADATVGLATWAGANAGAMTRDQAAGELAAMGNARGVVVYQYDQTPQTAAIWTKMDVTDTWAAGPLAGLLAGKTLAEAKTSPLEITDFRRANLN